MASLKRYDLDSVPTLINRELLETKVGASPEVIGWLKRYIKNRQERTPPYKSSDDHPIRTQNSKRSLRMDIENQWNTSETIANGPAREVSDKSTHVVAVPPSPRKDTLAPNLSQNIPFLSTSLLPNNLTQYSADCTAKQPLINLKSWLSYNESEASLSSFLMQPIKKDEPNDRLVSALALIEMANGTVVHQ